MPSADRRVPAQADRLESLAAGGGRKQRRRQRAAVSGGEGGGRWRRWLDGDLASATQISACGTRSSGVAPGAHKEVVQDGSSWAGLGVAGTPDTSDRECSEHWREAACRHTAAMRRSALGEPRRE